MILDLAGQKKEACKRLERAYKLDPTALRVAQAYGSLLSRQGTKDEALKVFTTFDEALPRHPLITEAIDDVKAGKKLPLVIDTPQAGAAEVLYGLGAALGRRGGEDLGLVYLQLALYLVPSHPLALLSLADLYEAMKKPELAIKTYERVPLTSPLLRNAQIQMALNLDTLERTDEAKANLEKLIAAHPADLEAIMALGNVLRGRKQFAECADVYSKGIATITKDEKSNWVIYYFRGICYERAKQWPKAETDLKKALELFPEQPHVLNYLGYSWVDQGLNLDEGMRMIKRAVEQRADDGYIVDSLGWAYYRLGNYRGGGEASRARRRAQAGRSDHQRPSRRRLLAGRPRARGEVPVVARARPQARARGTGEDRGEAQVGLAGRHLLGGRRPAGEEARRRLKPSFCRGDRARRASVAVQKSASFSRRVRIADF